VEHLLPEAEIATLEAEARLLQQRSSEITKIANERFEKTAGLLREAAEFESGMAIDIRATFSGFLLNYAADLKGKSIDRAKSAAESKRRHQELVEQTKGIKG
jgi:hypothetical protein